MMGPQSKTHCMKSMWRDLPAGVLEVVFTFLPIASLCRFRTLSTQWNRFISSPAFKHAGAAEEDYVLTTPRRGRLGREWVVLDVARERYFTLSNSFLSKHVQQLLEAAGASSRVRSYVAAYDGASHLAASDGGLFCVWHAFSATGWALFVCNPVLKTVKQLPRAAGPEWGPLTVIVMATHRSSMEYEIFIVTPENYRIEGRMFGARSILVYESKTGSWRTSSLQPYSDQIWWESRTVFNNILYCIVNRGNTSLDGLVSYDNETGMVSDLLGIDFPIGRSHLVVSKTRLFCVVTEVFGIQEDYSVEIFEIDVVERASTRVTAMSEALVHWVLGLDLDSRDVSEYKIKVATESAGCILICSVVGRCAAFSLFHKSWYQFPEDHTILEAYRADSGWLQPLLGSNSCISLCAP